ncbi:MAG: prepilin peptidase [Bacilli bacterium]|nr:prepilin peptidase [Bacilli bacterium]
MNLVFLIIFFVLGLYMGSFYTVVGLRLPNHENFISSRSYCDHCHHTLSLLDMVPLFSFLFLKRKCRYCKTKIDDLSTYMEFFTGVLFALSYYVFGFSYEFLFALGIVSMLIIVSVSDIRYYIIPDELLIFFSGYFLILTLLNDGLYGFMLAVGKGLLLFIAMYGIMLLGNYLFKKETLGGGDIKMMFVFGIILHPLLGLFTIFVGSVLALPVSLFLVMKKNQGIVPFGPFLLISLAFIYFTRIDVTMIMEYLRLL